MAAETKAFEFFDRALPEVADPEVRELFTVLRQEEVEHMQMVQEQMKKIPEETVTIRVISRTSRLLNSCQQSAVSSHFNRKDLTADSYSRRMPSDVQNLYPKPRLTTSGLASNVMVGRFSPSILTCASTDVPEYRMSTLAYQRLSNW